MAVAATQEIDVWSGLASTLRASEPYRILRDRSQTGRGCDVERLPTPAAAWVLQVLAAELERPLLVVAPNEAEAYVWYESLRLFAGGEEGRADGVVSMPASSLSPYQEAETSLLVRAEEAIAVDRMTRGVARTVVTTPRSLFRRLPCAADFAPGVRTVAVEEEHPVEELVEHLSRFGYRRSDLVMEIGDFAVRGGVFDVYPPGESLPLRLDLFGDTVESIRRFEPESQRSRGTVGALRLLPLALFPEGPEEAELLAELLAEMAGPSPSEDIVRTLRDVRAGTGFDGWQHYLPLLESQTVTLPSLLAGATGPDPLVVAIEVATLGAEVAEHRVALEGDCAARRSAGKVAPPPEGLEHEEDIVRAVLDRAQVRLSLVLDAPAALGTDDSLSAIDFGGTWTARLHEQLPRFPREVEIAHGRGDRVFLVAPADHRQKLGEMLDTFEVPQGGAGVEIVAGDLQRGFRLPGAGVTVFGERQLLRRSPIVKRRSRARFGPFLSSLRDLKIGDYVVHMDHGIGQFVGLRNLGESATENANLPASLRDAAPVAAGDTEVMEIIYAVGKRLLMPLSRLDQIQKYSGIESVAPRLDKLGGTSWRRTKQRIKKGMRDMADELLKLYAQRQLAQAPVMPPDSDLVRQFEAAFVYEETPDQLEAIAAIKADLQLARPMDRLLCGDVGFGKTEVAMRAAFKAVDSGYQVAILAPTTILADQHLDTFRARFRAFPVEIDMVSRFRSPKEIRAIQKRMVEGKIDVLVGTHRLLGKGFEMARLGLLIVDEEQRFGVAQKERLKTFKKDVHVLAMSATPVPRTLQLSLAGVRDLALIETPPRDRMAVETAIVPFDTGLIREAIIFEIERGGQVFFVHNQVETIEQMSAFLRELVPGLRLTVGHGQLRESELSKRMHAFIAGEHDVLLATTIIENGIDIPNVNTIIVQNAQRFGLSQLYQLRGRVGRSDQLAYCYLVVPQDRILSEQARKRLHAIREFTELGAGFRVAGRDLEIRGAGNLLGGEQSGHIGAVGIETYLKMLEETVAELKGEVPVDAPSVTLDLPVPMSIPEAYVGDANLRMEVYQRIVTSDDNEDEILAELHDRFGPPPDGVRAFLEVAMLKRQAEALRLQSIAARGGRLTFRLRQDVRVEPERLIAFVSEQPGRHFSPSGVLSIEKVPSGELVSVARDTLAQLAS